MTKIFLFVLLTISCLAQNDVLLSKVEKEFIVLKYVKIQADIDDLKYNHITYQNDSLQYNQEINSTFRLDQVNQIGLNSFQIDSTGNYESDIHIVKLKVAGLGNTDFDLYGARHLLGLEYFIAIDDSGWVFPLENFWIDDFQRLIKKKIGKVDSFDKAIEVARIYIATKLYLNEQGIIIEKNNIIDMKNDYQHLGFVHELKPMCVEKIAFVTIPSKHMYITLLVLCY